MGRRWKRLRPLISGSDIGIIGFGDLGRALNRVLSGFRAKISVFDPWLPQSILRDHGVTPASLDDVLENSDFLFVVAAVTSENNGFLNPMPSRGCGGGGVHPAQPGRRGGFPRADGRRRLGHIVAASDVFPEEPLAADHPVRG